MQRCKFIMKHLRITQSYGVDASGNVDSSSYSHKGSYALDLGGKDTGIDTAYAPCDVEVKRIYGSYNAVWFETLEEVLCADGQARKLVFMLLHCNSDDIKALGIKVGKVFKQGEPFYKEGVAGNVTGAHIHLEVGEAPFTGTGWHKNEYGVWTINNQLVPHEIFYLDKETVVLNDGGYDWGTEITVQPLSEHSVPLKIGYASSGDINTMVNVIEEIGGIDTEVKDGYIYTTPASKGDQVAILIKCDELEIDCVIYEKPAEEPTTEENSVTYLVGPIPIENQAEFEAKCDELGVPCEVYEETPEQDEPVGNTDKLPDETPAEQPNIDEIEEIDPEPEGTQEPEHEKPEADKEPAKEESGENEANTGAGAEDNNVPGKVETDTNVGTKEPEVPDTNVGDIGINEDTYQPGMWEEPEEPSLLDKALDWLVKIIKKLLG